MRRTAVRLLGMVSLAMAALIFAMPAPAVAAATTTIEAENMTLGTGMVVRTGPPAHVAFLANSGTNGAKKTGITTGALDRVTIYAWAKQACTAWPIAELYVDSVRVGSPGVTVNTTTSAAYSVPLNVAAGTHSLEIRFNNDGGNGTCDINLYVDRTVLSGPDLAATSPDTTITSGPANGTSTDASFSFTGTDNIGVTGFDCRLDGAAFAACSSAKTYTGLAVGTHTFDVRAKDAAGNVDATPASRAWAISAPPPPVGGSFPRLMSTHFAISSTADAQALAKWDWVVTSGPYASYWPTLRSTNPNIKISAYIDGTEDNGSQTSGTTCASPNQLNDPNLTADKESLDSWWLKNYDGTYPNMPGQTGRKMVNPTAFVPASASGERWNEHLAAWLARCYRDVRGADGVALDMTNDTSLYASEWPFWDLTQKTGTKLDLDRNGVQDTFEHGTAWVNNTWGAATRDMVAKVRAAVGSSFIVDSNSGSGRTYAPHANGQTYEHGSDVSSGVFNDSLMGLMRQWDTAHYGTLYSAMQSEPGSAGQTNYAFMRHNLAATLMTDAHFGQACGACNYNTNWWYDEYSVNTTTGVATGDASRKGYLGSANGRAVKLGNGLWRRDFANGIALANNTSGSITYSLGGTFRKIAGTQNPAVNNGQSVSSVTLPAQGGLILLR